jgi:hypothetical protein
VTEDDLRKRWYQVSVYPTFGPHGDYWVVEANNNPYDKHHYPGDWQQIGYGDTREEALDSAIKYTERMK